MSDDQPGTGDTQEPTHTTGGDQQQAGGDQSSTSSANQGGGEGGHQSGTGESSWSALLKELEDEGLTPGQVTERLKASRKWEDRAKQNAKAQAELDKLKRAQMSEQEKAVAQARDETETKVRQEMGEDLARAELKAAAAGKVAGIDDFIEDLKLTKFLDESGRPDSKAIKAAVERWSKIAPASSSPPPADLKQGSRGAPPQADPNAWLRRAAGRQ
ncbi:hypothetical protein [Streptomonospora litoralis]|uniref:Scaffolding protein n=1 Tax=Streptomonospora litoralis TaxID=2498135 RepID=A0A4P6Q050_9ACTN|nr:hypothetical protein [Streptomonospora litoralis]QBI53430.1 hypothetical protein EKD16_08180 [Streptomonospora litoralis]